MSYYRTANKIIYRRYRLLMKIIRSYEYFNIIQFRKSILSLIRFMRKYINMLYGYNEYLMPLINYYEIQCIDCMYERISSEIKREVV